MSDRTTLTQSDISPTQSDICPFSIRAITRDDLSDVSQICMAAFMGSVASGLSEEGIGTFKCIAAADSFAERMDGDNVILVACSGAQIQGVIELKEGRHIAMLFVRPDAQGKGIGRKLMAAVRPWCRTATVTVSASLTSVSAYEQFGFQCTGEPGEIAGLKYQPMEWQVTETVS